MPVYLTCSACGRPFSRTPAKAGAYCSQTCHRQEAQRPGPIALSDDGTTGLVPLYAHDGSVRAHAIIDASDIAWASQWRWHLDTKGYAARSGVSIRLHRELLGLRPGDTRQGDHIDRNKLNDRRANLRIASHQGNMQNRPSQRGSSSSYRGVSFNRKLAKWQASIQIGPKKTYLGVFAEEREAAEVARLARANLMPYATD